MKKALSIFVTLVLALSSSAICFADDTYYIGDFNRSIDELQNSNSNYDIMTETELNHASKMKYQVKLSAKSSFEDISNSKEIVLGHNTNDGGLVLNAMKQGTEGYKEVVDHGYTDINYSFWGTWCWANKYFCNQTLYYLDKGSKAATIVKGVTSHMGPLLVMTGVSTTTVAAGEVLADVTDILCTSGTEMIEREMTDMGISVKTGITGLTIQKVEGQYVAKIF